MRIVLKYLETHQKKKSERERVKNKTNKKKYKKEQ